MPFIWPACLWTRHGNIIANQLEIFRKYAEEHDTSRGRFYGFIVEVWRTATFIVTSLAVGFFYLIQ